MFVDDEAIMVESSEPLDLTERVGRVLEIVTNASSHYDLKFNWRKGKSEAVVRLAGRHCCLALETLRQPDGNLAITLPERCGREVLHMVSCHKHLGTFVTRDVCDAKDARFKSQNAMSANVTHIPSVHSSPCYTVAMKLPSPRK